MREQEISKKNVFFIVGLFFIILLSVGSIILVSFQKSKIVKVDAVVKELQNFNMVVVDDSGVEYLLPNIDEYQIGDRVSFEMRNLDKDGDFVEGEILKMETVSKSVHFTITDSEEMETEEKNNILTDSLIINDKENSMKNDSVVSGDSSNTSEEEIIAYFTNLENEIQTTTASDITSSLKTGFVTVVDFLFYNGTIKGKTFSELSDTAKLKVLKLAFSIDSKIEEKFPGYKEEIKVTGSKMYTNVKLKVLETYFNLSTKVCENNSDVCTSAKEGLRDLKTNFSLTWSFIKEISGVGVSKLKSWYEIWRES